MKLHYMGKYNLDPTSLPHKEHQPGAVMFKEAKDSKTMAIIANILAFIIIILAIIPIVMQYIPAESTDIFKLSFSLCIGSLLSMVVLFPHEFLHAVCFKEDVYVYTNLKQGMLFVVGPETMSKSRFVFMSLLPNLVFGFIPYIIQLICPIHPILGFFSASCIGSGAGDYYNVFNALTQMPKGARTYLYQFNSYWYMP